MIRMTCAIDTHKFIASLEVIEHNTILVANSSVNTHNIERSRRQQPTHANTHKKRPTATHNIYSSGNMLIC